MDKYCLKKIETPRMAEESLRSLVREKSPTLITEHFQDITCLLACSLQMPFALIARRLDSQQYRIRSLAFWNEHTWQESFEYDLTGTPCERIYREGFYCFTHDVQRLFPNDKDLSKLNIESYAGAPIVDSQITMGHVCVLDTKPIMDIHHIYDLLHLVAEETAPLVINYKFSPEKEI